MKSVFAGGLLCLVASLATAADVPRAGTRDSRVRMVTYQADEVTIIKAQRGTGTRIILEPGERIEVSMPGLSSRCDVDTDEWCIRAEKGTNQIWIRPKDKATKNNLELQTNRRDYSFAFDVLPDPENSPHKKGEKPREEPFFRVAFEYPASAEAVRASVVAGLLGSIGAPAVVNNADAMASSASLSPKAMLKAIPHEVRNTKYTMQVMEHGQEAAPSLVYDDGRFTLFEYKGSRDIPAIFFHSADGTEIRPNWHFEPPFVVVERLARKFTIRIGNAVVGVFNEAFDAEGIDTLTGTVTPAVLREIKGEQQ